MGSPDALDIEAIRRPIAGEYPAGPNPRADASPNSAYYRLKEARGAARLAEREAETGEPKRSADWGAVLGLGAKILENESKDLEIAAWTTEALGRMHGFAGLALGFQALRILVDGFWEGVWPRPDDDGLTTRLAALTGLNGEDTAGTLIAPIDRILITSGSEGGFASWHYRKALDVSRITDAQRRERAAAAGGVTLEAFQRSVAETPADFFRELVADLQASLTEFEGLCEKLESRCRASIPPAEAPPSSNIRNALREVLEIVQAVAKDKLAAPAAQARPGATAVGGDPLSATQVPSSGGFTREAAFQTLVRVAEYFRHAEPHSPLSYSLEQAVRWGRMPLPDLLGELIPDEGARSQYMKLAGIPGTKKE